MQGTLLWGSLCLYPHLPPSQYLLLSGVGGHMQHIAHQQQDPLDQQRVLLLPLLPVLQCMAVSTPMHPPRPQPHNPLPPPDLQPHSSPPSPSRPMATPPHTSPPQTLSSTDLTPPPEAPSPTHQTPAP